MSDSKTFESLIEKHKGIVLKVSSMYIDDFDERKDVQQEILLQAWKSFPNFKEKSTFGTWLYKVALNTTLSWMKKQPDTHENLNRVVHVSDGNSKHELKEHLLQAIKQLPEIDRAIVSMHLDGFEHESIAEVFGTSRNNINVRLHRAKQALSKLLMEA